MRLLPHRSVQLVHLFSDVPSPAHVRVASDFAVRPDAAGCRASSRFRLPADFHFNSCSITRIFPRVRDTRCGAMRLPELRLWKPRQAGPEDNDDGEDEPAESAPGNDEGGGEEEVGGENDDPEITGPSEDEGEPEGGGGVEGGSGTPTQTPTGTSTTDSSLVPTPSSTLLSSSTRTTLSVSPVSPPPTSRISESRSIVDVPPSSSAVEIGPNTFATVTASVPQITAPFETPAVVSATPVAVLSTSSALGVVAAEVASSSTLTASPVVVLSPTITEATLIPLTTSVPIPILALSTEALSTEAFDPVFPSGWYPR